MAKALKQINDKQSLADLFIVVLDARAPLSSYNEEFDKIAPHKPRLFVITKVDLSDTTKLDAIKAKFNNDRNGILLVDLKKKSSQKKIIKESERLLLDKKQRDMKKGLLKPRQRAIVVGVPNSGKSTLINLVSNSSKAKVGNMPGVTKGQQWIKAGNIQLLDTPGILWPKFDDEFTGVKLAIIGSIKTSIIPQMELFNAGYKLLTEYYPKKIEALGLEPSKDENVIYNNLLTLCETKKWMLKDGKANIAKAQLYFTHYLRDLKGVTYD